MINYVSATKNLKSGNFGNCCFWLQKSVKLKEEFIRITDLGFRFASKLNGSLVLILINHGHTTLGKPIFLFRDELEKRGLSKAGKKDELIQRLESYLEVSIKGLYLKELNKHPPPFGPPILRLGNILINIIYYSL